MSMLTIHRKIRFPAFPGLTSERRPAGLLALRHLTPLAGAAGLLVLASACAPGSPHQASATAARPRHTAAPAPAASRPAPAPAASRPTRAASPATGATGAAGSTDATAPGYTGPHFTTPQAAMSYLAAAYNRDDTTALHAVTDPQAFTALLAMRSSDADLQLTSCTPTQRGDYMCSVRYSYPGGHRTAMLTTAPAQNPGWYMYRFLSGCD